MGHIDKANGAPCADITAWIRSHLEFWKFLREKMYFTYEQAKDYCKSLH